METISQRFNFIKKFSPHVGDYIILSKAIRGMHFGKMKVFDAFNKYVNKRDYDLEEKDMLLENLLKKNNSDKRANLSLFLATAEK